MPSGIANSCIRAINVDDMYRRRRIDHRACQAGGGVTPLFYQSFLLELYVEHGPDLLNCSRNFPGEVETNDDWRDRSVGI